MRKQSISLISLILILILLSGCGDDETGACLWGSGFSGRCWDGYTRGQCNMMNGSLQVGSTCSDYGYGKSAESMFAISEVFYQGKEGGAGIGWVEMFNSSPQPINLEGFSIVQANAEGGITVVELSGVVGSCSTFVVGHSDSDGSNGYPDLDQSAQFDNGQSSAENSGVLVALFMPGDRFGVNCPLSALVLGNQEYAGLGGNVCTVNVARMEMKSQGVSFERADWSTDGWVNRSVSDPNMVSPDLECKSADERSWATMTSVY